MTKAGNISNPLVITVSNELIVLICSQLCDTFVIQICLNNKPYVVELHCFSKVDVMQLKLNKIKYTRYI